MAGETKDPSWLLGLHDSEMYATPELTRILNMARGGHSPSKPDTEGERKEMRELIMQFVPEEGQPSRLPNNNWGALDQIQRLLETHRLGSLECSLPEVAPIALKVSCVEVSAKAEQWVSACIRAAKDISLEEF